jgi:hypothetical protein
MRKHLVLSMGLLLLCCSVRAEEGAVIDVADKATLDAAKGTDVIVQGKVSKAEWSKSGKVCNVEFENAPHFMCAAFDRNKEKLDAAFNGDFAKAMTGATVKISGKLAPYGGRIEALKEATQIVIKETRQVTFVATSDAPATQPTTQP